MSIEKNLETVFDKKQSTANEKTEKNRIRRWVSSSRFNVRQKFKNDHVTFSTFLTFIPIALGFSHFLFHYLSSNKTNSFFQQNLPALKNFEPKVTLETYEYLAKSDVVLTQNFGPLSNEKDESDFHHFFLEQRPFSFGQPKFLAKVKTISEGKKSMFPGGIKKDFFVLPSGNFAYTSSLVETVPGNLDELPSYLEGLHHKSDFQEPLEFKKNKKGHKLSLSSDFSNSFLRKSNSNESTGKNTTKRMNCLEFFSHSSNFQDQISFSFVSPRDSLIKSLGKNKLALKEVDQKKSSFSQNTLYKNRLDFYTKANQLDAELQNLFIEKNICSFLPVLEDKEPTPFHFLKEAVLSEMVLQDLENKKIGEEGSPARTMSGYMYPDTNALDLQWFSFFNKKKPPIFSVRPPAWNFFSFNEKSKRLKTFPFLTQNNQFILGKEPTKLVPETWKVRPQNRVLGEVKESTLFSFWNIKDFPKFLIETKHVLLRKGDANQEIYAGPSLVLDSQKNFDWKTSHDENLRSWFQKYLSPENSLVQFHSNFFGNYSSPEFGSSQKEWHKTSDLPLPKVSDFLNSSFLHLKLTKTPETKWVHYDWIYDSDSIPSLFAPIQSSLHIPLAENQSKIAEENLRGFSVTLPKKDVEHFFPLLELKQPVVSPESYSSLFDFGVKGNPDAYFSSGAFVSSNSTPLASGQYRKFSSIFSKKQPSTSLFVTNWEPLTSSSWLVISQLSFALFIFHVLKDLADNYGRELLGYLLDLVSALGILDDSLKQQIQALTGQRNQGFRVVLKSRKTFADIVGIQKLLLEIYEVVLFLRNSARDFTLSKTLPHGILLTGPPGTGKTLLVQAIAGEAQVPVVVLSGSSLIQPGESAALKLQLAFQEARNLAPCIVFIDEIDTCSSKRSQMVQNPMATDQGFDSFLESLILESKVGFEKTEAEPTLTFSPSGAANSETGKQEKVFLPPNSDQREKELSLLSQLLIELDGVQGRDGVVVIGATNRPEILDPALLRPGRFEKMVQVGLPDQQKRLEILKFYGQRVGYSKTLPWNYLGERTAGFTAADLATLMNESTIKAIFNKTTHTIETLEHGIDRLTTSENEKYTIFKTSNSATLRGSKNSVFEKEEGVNSEKTLRISSKMLILRLAYYQAGKLLLTYALETHPKSVVASLWPRRPTIRSFQITTNLQNSLFEFARVCELHDRLVGCYAGKAAEFLFLQKFSSKALSKNSTLGLDDILFGQKLISFMLDKCRFSSKKQQTQKTLPLQANYNMYEFRKNLERIDLYAELMQNLQTPPMWKAIEEDTSSLRAKKANFSFPLHEQMYYWVPWWQQEISDEMEFNPKNPANGSRLYLYNSERTQRNPEWRPPDAYYHNVSGLKNVKTAFANILRVRQNKQGPSDEKKPLKKNTKSLQSSVSPAGKNRNTFVPWNEMSKLTRDYASHSLVLQSFNKALVLLNENRELLDRMVVELIYHEVLRKQDIEALLHNFPLGKKDLQKVDHTDNQVKIIEFSWGSQSRKPLPRWIDFAAFSQKTTEKP